RFAAPSRSSSNRPSTREGSDRLRARYGCRRCRTPRRHRPSFRRPMPEQTVQAGRIVEIKGVVIDAVFPAGLPELYTAISITIPGQVGRDERTIIAEA